ncbi:MAG TPA: hypothetical protein VGL93_24160 [Streptosporangiaceae bacterium]|jgi:hypothetical protein
MERPGGADRPEPPPRPSGRDHPSHRLRPLADEPVLEPYARHLHRPDLPRLDGPGREAPDAALRRFRPERIGLAPLTQSQADDHVIRYAGARPWLAIARYTSPEVRRILVALDQGRGHALERHEGAVTPAQTEARVRLLCDPAIPGPERTPGVDAYKPPGKWHGCGDTATRITDPDAFAVCVARAIEHPRVRAELDAPLDPSHPAGRIDIPLAEVLGADGYRYCDGHRLKAIGNDRQVAVECRDAWVYALRNQQAPDVPEPRSVRLAPDDFRQAAVRLFLCPTRDRSGLEIATMFVEPARPGGGR